MNNILINSNYFGFIITMIGFYLATELKNKTKNSLLNPLLITTIFIIIFLLIFGIKYETYNNGAKYISFFLTPTTVCLAVPLYKQINILKHNIIAIVSGILGGVISNIIIIVTFSKLFNFNNQLLASLLPKSITAPIAIGLSEELNGLPSITVFAVILSGIIGATIAPTIFKILKIKEPIAQGLSCGTSAHGSGTSIALELGELQGAISSLAITITGIITTIIVPIIYKYMQ